MFVVEGHLMSQQLKMLQPCIQQFKGMVSFFVCGTVVCGTVGALSSVDEAYALLENSKVI